MKSEREREGGQETDLDIIFLILRCSYRTGLSS